MSSVVGFNRSTNTFWMINTPHFHFTPSSFDVGICLMAVVPNIFTASIVSGALSHLHPVTKNLSNIISEKDSKRAVGVCLKLFKQSFFRLPYSDGCIQIVVFLPVGGRQLSCYDPSAAGWNARSLLHPEDHQQAARCEDTSCVRCCVHYAVLRLPTDAHTHVPNRILGIRTRHSQLWCNSRGSLGVRISDHNRTTLRAILFPVSVGNLNVKNSAQNKYQMAHRVSAVGFLPLRFFSFFHIHHPT